jgi:hypothetical protein
VQTEIKVIKQHSSPDYFFLHTLCGHDNTDIRYIFHTFEGVHLTQKKSQKTPRARAEKPEISNLF